MMASEKATAGGREPESKLASQLLRRVRRAGTPRVGARRRRRTLVGIGLLLALFFLLDVFAPRAIASGEPYVLAVVASAWLQQRAGTLLTAAAASLLLFLGYWLGHAAGVQELTDRGVSLGLIWLSAALVVVLLRANRRFQLALEAMPAPVMLMNEAGMILLANSRAERLFGYAPGGLLDERVIRLVPERHRDRFAAAQRDFLKSATDGKGVTRELVARRADGSELHVETTVHPLETRRGLVLLLALRDLSNRRFLQLEKDRLAAIVQTSSDAIVAVGLDGTVTSWNEGAQAIYGYTSEEMIGLPLWALVPPEREGELRRFLEGLARGMRVRQVEGEHVTKSGERLRVAISASPVRDAEGRIAGAAMIARNVTPQKRAEALLVEMNLALANAMPGHAYVDTDGRVTTANEALRAMVPAGHLRESVDWRAPFDAADAEALDRGYEEMLKGGKTELTVRGRAEPNEGTAPAAEPRHFDVLLVKRNGPGGAFQGHHLFVRDVSARERAETELRLLAERLERANDDLERLADVDPLTGLLNRRGLERFLATETSRARREGSSVIAVLLDLDEFKSVNERYGHHGGDVALEAVAERIRRVLRAYDGAARIGGDEFLLVLPATRLAEGRLVAERLRASIAAEPIELPRLDGGAMEIHVTCSLGLAEVEERSPTIAGLLMRTRAALERAKEGGKDRVSGVESSRSEPDVLAAILDRELLSVVQQPIFDLRDGRIVAHELLIRGPRGPYELPDHLFAACAARDLLVRMDLLALKHSVLRVRRLAPEHRLHFNVFPETLLSGRLDDVLSLLSQLPTDRAACIELNEHAFTGDPATLRPALDALRKAGHQIALDDVGFGKSALETLAVLEPELVKVDRRVVTGAAGDPGRTRALDRLLGVVHGLRALPIAEGVEQAEDCELLLRLGVRFAQGYALERPMAFDEGAETQVELIPHRGALPGALGRSDAARESGEGQG